MSELSAEVEIGSGVFFNEKMRCLRSISAAFVKSFAGKGSTLLDSTTATGIRGIRYSLESGIRNPVLIDMNKGAYSCASANVKSNRIDADVRNVSMQEFANTYEGRFDFIDIDPFGSPAPMIYDSLKLAKNGTMLMVTATDTAVLFGAHRNACIKIYGAEPLHTELCKEAGTRILLAYITRNASQFNFGIEPVMCISDMHYVRVFLRLVHGAVPAVRSARSSGFAGQCQSCRSFEYGNGIAPVGSKCARCGGKMLLSGQMWMGLLSNRTAIAKVIKSAEGINDPEASEYVRRVSEEIDVPFLYSVPKLTKALSMGSVSHKKVILRIQETGKMATATQYWKDSLKTDAGYDDVIAAIKT